MFKPHLFGNYLTCFGKAYMETRLCNGNVLSRLTVLITPWPFSSDQVLVFASMLTFYI